MAVKKSLPESILSSQIKAGSLVPTHASTWLEIDRAALLHNAAQTKRLAGRGEIIAVIKANAYGHGMETVASALSDQVDMFAVTRFQEVLRLREHGIETPVLILGPVTPDEMPSAARSRATLTVSSLSDARTIEQEAARRKRTIPVHVKIDTGMGRLGIPHAEAVTLIRKIVALPHIRIDGLYTHFAASDETAKKDFSNLQIGRFRRAVDALTAAGIPIKKTHLSNSGGLVRLGLAGGNAVRPGIMLYGMLPNALSSSLSRLDLKAVLAWRAKIIMTKELERGQSVGYGCAFVAKKRSRVAWVPVGYSHGYPLALSSRAYVLIKGKRYPVAGRVSMDFLAVDLGKNRDIKIGDTVTLLGSEGDRHISALDLARWAGTIPYEITTRIHPALPRIVRA